MFDSGWRICLIGRRASEILGRKPPIHTRISRLSGRVDEWNERARQLSRWIDRSGACACRTGSQDWQSGTRVSALEARIDPIQTLICERLSFKSAQQGPLSDEQSPKSSTRASIARLRVLFSKSGALTCHQRSLESQTQGRISREVRSICSSPQLKGERTRHRCRREACLT